MPNRDRTQSIESRPAPRRSESSVSQTQPAIKVVGFRVEGAAPSPSPPSTLLADSQRIEDNVISGSPNPVIIPPSFQVQRQEQCQLSGSLKRRHAAMAVEQQHRGFMQYLCPGCRLTHQYSKQQTGEAGMHSCQLSPLCGRGLLLYVCQAVFQMAATCRCQSPTVYLVTLSYSAVLDICTQLSTCKHHTNCLGVVQDSSILVQHTARTHTTNPR